MSPDPIYRRNAGLRRISNITKGALAGGLILTGGLSALAAKSFSGTATATQSSTQSVQTPLSSSSRSSDDESTNPATPTLQAPSYYLQPSSGSGRVRSGGS